MEIEGWWEAASAPIKSQEYKAAIVFELQAGVSLIGGVRADADFRPRGMVGLAVFSCSLRL